jgi:opacity protein-like surface antigen
MSTVGTASAEWFADLYAGASVTERHDLTLGFLGTDFEVNNVNFETSATVGGRFGYWIDPLPYLGAGLDVFHFRPDVRSQTARVCQTGGCFSDPLIQFDLSMIGISLDLMARLPLMTSPEFPTGRFNPYVTIGPVLFIAQGRDLVTDGGPITRSNTDYALGGKVGGGFAFRLHRNVALFAEYRYTVSEPDFLSEDVFIVGTNNRVETRLTTHHGVVGISLRY